MSELIDKEIASKFADNVPEAQRIVLAQNVKPQTNPVLWILFIIASVFLVYSVLEVAGITNFSQEPGNHRQIPWLTLAISVNSFWITLSLLLRRRSCQVIVTDRASVIVDKTNLNSEKISAIELKAPKYLLLHWKISDEDFTEAPIKLTFDDAEKAARKLSDLIQIPVSQFNGFVLKHIYQPKKISNEQT